MHISIEEVFKHLFASMDNIQTSFFDQDMFNSIVAEFSLFGGPLPVLLSNVLITK